MLAAVRRTVLFQRSVAIVANDSVAREKSTSTSLPIDRSNVPEINESDLEEKFISGSGPGGQCVNKSVNCCQLRHKPTNLVVKVHHTRSLEKNRQIARELLVAKLDDLYNGENSVSSQKKQIALKKLAIREVQAERRRAMKEEFKRNLVENQSNDDDNK